MLEFQDGCFYVRVSPNFGSMQYYFRTLFGGHFNSQGSPLTEDAQKYSLLCLTYYI